MNKGKDEILQKFLLLPPINYYMFVTQMLQYIRVKDLQINSHEYLLYPYNKYRRILIMCFNFNCNLYELICNIFKNCQ